MALLGLPEDIAATSVFISGFEAQGTVTARFGTAQADWIYSKISDSRLPSEVLGEEGKDYRGPMAEYGAFYLAFCATAQPRKFLPHWKSTSWCMSCARF